MVCCQRDKTKPYRLEEKEFRTDLDNLRDHLYKAAAEEENVYRKELLQSVVSSIDSYIQERFDLNFMHFSHNRLKTLPELIKPAYVLYYHFDSCRQSKHHNREIIGSPALQCFSLAASIQNCFIQMPFLSLVDWQPEIISTRLAEMISEAANQHLFIKALGNVSAAPKRPSFLEPMWVNCLPCLFWVLTKLIYFSCVLLTNLLLRH